MAIARHPPSMLGFRIRSTYLNSFETFFVVYFRAVLPLNQLHASQDSTCNSVSFNQETFPINSKLDVSCLNLTDTFIRC